MNDIALNQSKLTPTMKVIQSKNKTTALINEGIYFKINFI